MLASDGLSPTNGCTRVVHMHIISAIRWSYLPYCYASDMKYLQYLLIAISRTLHLVCVTKECIALTLLIARGRRPNEFVMPGVRAECFSQYAPG